MMKEFLIYGGVIYSLLLLIVYLRQDSFIFFPTDTKHPPPDDSSIIEYSFSHTGQTLNGWLVNKEYVHDSLIIYYGGNAEDVYYSIPEMQDIQQSAVLLVNYRGYGTSSGKPGEEAFFQDSVAIFDDVQKRYSPKKTYLIGRSLGSGVASYAASKKRATGVILVTPFDSLKSLARRQFPFFPTSLLLKHNFLSTDYVEKITCPTLVIYGGRDSIIPEKLTLRLLNSFKVDVRSVLIKDGGHNNIETFEKYRQSIQSFLHSATSAELL